MAAGLDRRGLAARMADAARVWLGLLDAEQRAIAKGVRPSEGDADEERRRWFYTPTDHGGLTFHQQRPAQQQAAMRLVSTGLSQAGFVTVATTIGLENVLDHAEGFPASSSGRERRRDPGLYYLRVFGEPGDGTWGWRFGGHHVSLNNLVADGEVVATTPCFMGADPASSELLGGAVNRPLARVEDLARELVESLDGEQRRRAILSVEAPADVLTGNRSTISEQDDPVRGRGVAGSELSAGQRDLLRALLATYFGRVPEAVSPLPAYEGDALDAVRFAWAGPTGPGEPHYYRVQGPRLLIEWDNTQRGANHAHSVWRDPGNDFGLDVLRGHRRDHHLNDAG